MKEKWKQIEGYPNHYVSNHGNVLSCVKNSNGLRLKSVIAYMNQGRPYLGYPLSKDRKKKVIAAHKLVWNAFGNGKIPDGHYFVIDHIDENPSNNRIDNLRILSVNRNVARGYEKGRDLPTGVRRVPTTGKFVAGVNHLNKTHHLGTFDTPEEASQAYQKKLEEFGL